MARINIPAKPGELIDLCVAIADGHKKLGKSSPLSILKWNEITPTVTEADELDDKIGELSRELDQLTERRKGLIDKPDGLADFARQSRDILMGVHRNELTKLNDFGFEVADSPKTRKANGNGSIGSNGPNGPVAQ
jgi:hypothetical protein